MGLLDKIKELFGGGKDADQGAGAPPPGDQPGQPPPPPPGDPGAPPPR